MDLTPAQKRKTTIQAKQAREAAAKAEREYLGAKVGRPTKEFNAKIVQVRESATKLQQAMRGKIARTALNKTRKETEAVQNAKAKITDAIKARKAKLQALKLQRDKIKKLSKENEKEYNTLHSELVSLWDLEEERTGALSGETDPIEREIWVLGKMQEWYSKIEKSKKLFVLKNNANYRNFNDFEGQSYYAR